MRVVSFPCGILVGLAPPIKENRAIRVALTCRAAREGCFVWHYMGGRSFIAERPRGAPNYVAIPMRKADVKRLGIKDQLPSLVVIKAGLIEVSPNDLVVLHLLADFDPALGKAS